MNLNPNLAPRARGFDTIFCGHCPNAHLVYFDHQGSYICHATISLSQCRTIEAAILARDPNFKEAPL